MRFFLCLIFLAVVGCGEREVAPEEVREKRFGDELDFLSHADRVEIFSVESSSAGEDVAEEDLFRGHAILGKLVLNKADVLKDVVNDLNQRVLGSEYYGGSPCFSPRHGVRAVKGDEVRDYLFCFEFGHLSIFHDRGIDLYKYVPLELGAERLEMNRLLDAAGIEREKP